MSANTLFLEKISQIKKFILLKTLHQIVLITLLIFLCVYTIGVGLEKTGLSLVRGYVSFYPISLAVSLVISLVYAYLKREGFPNVLIGIDTRLNLKDRISTAYEYQKFGKQSEFADLLAEDAGRRLSLLGNKQLVPSKFSTIYLLLSILIIINIALAFVDYESFVSKQLQVDQEQAKKISTLLQNYPVKKPQEADKAKENARKRIQEKMDNLAKKLEEQTMTRNELLKSLHKTLKEVQSEQTRLAKDLDSKLAEMKNIEGINIQKTLQLKRLSSNKLKRVSELKKMLNKMLDNDVPNFIEEDFALLNEHYNLAETLEQIIDDIESDTDDADESDSDGTTTQDANDSKSGDNEDSQEGRASSDLDQGEEGDNFDQDGLGQMQYPYGYQGPGEDTFWEEGEEGDFSQPGRGKSKGQRMSPYKLERARGPAIQDRTFVAPKDDYNVHIRSVTKIGKATLPEEDVTRPYRQELESILQKEDMPLNYREYIKNYFISIGLRKGEKSNATTK